MLSNEFATDQDRSEAQGQAASSASGEAQKAQGRRDPKGFACQAGEGTGENKASPKGKSQEQEEQKVD